MSKRMEISMTGIDYGTAGVALREKYAFTAKKAAEFAARLTERKLAGECVVLSTCNRTELWMFAAGANPTDCLLEEKTEGSGEAPVSFTVREGEEAVSYLMQLACGMRSQIYGEDQIISQIKDALAASGETGAAGPVLKKLFLTAVTAAKRVKTEVRLTGRETSAAEKAVRTVEERAGTLSGKNCLVIGSGVMGQLIAKTLLLKGAGVTVTVRALHRANSRMPDACGNQPAYAVKNRTADAVKNRTAVPEGAAAIPYEDRYQSLLGCDAVFSATASPHFTLTAEETRRALSGQGEEKERYFADLAVPRDIDPGIRTVSGCMVYDMDDFSDEQDTERRNGRRKEALAILAEYEEEFRDWYEFRELVPVVGEIADRLAELSEARLGRVYRKLALTEGETEELREQVRESTKKTVAGLLYSLKEHIGREQWDECYSVLKQAAEDYTAVRN